MPPDLKILQLNCNSLRSKILEIVNTYHGENNIMINGSCTTGNITQSKHRTFSTELYNHQKRSGKRQR